MIIILTQTLTRITLMPIRYRPKPQVVRIKGIIHEHRQRQLKLAMSEVFEREDNQRPQVKEQNQQ